MVLKSLQINDLLWYECIKNNLDNATFARGGISRIPILFVSSLIVNGSRRF